MFKRISESFLTKSTAIALIFSFFLMSFTTAPQSGKIVIIKAGTPIALELMNTINSNDVKNGQMIDFRVINDVKVDGEVVIPAGSIAKGQIDKAKKNGLLGTPGEVSVVIKSVNAVDGTIVPLSSSAVGDEGSDKLVVSIVLTVLCLFGFIIKGGEAKIASGAQINATVLSNTEVNL